MGQIVFNEQKPKYANLLAIKTGSQKDYPIPANEVWLIDSNNASKPNGKGKYDKYIVGDGQTAAKNLPLLDIDPDVPTHLSQLIADENHKTVKEEDIQRWNTGTGGGGTPVASSDDITVVNDAQESVNRLQFANKTYDSSEYSGLGKVYIRKNIQTVHTKTSEVLFNAFSATAIYNTAYDNSYNAKYKELIEAGTYDADGKTAASSAYTTAYNEAVTAGKTTVEATNLGNAAYVKAYKAAIKGDEDAEAAVTSVNTASDNAGITAGNTAWSTEYSDIAAWNRQYYIDGRFTTIGDDKYINITPQYRFSITSCKIEVHAGEIYKIFAKISDTAGGIDWLSRFWMITETPASGSTTAKVLQAYKINNENNEGQRNDTAFIEVEHDGILWINYNTYAGAAGQCKIEKISDTSSTVDVNAISGLNSSNTEYIVQYDYDLNGGLLNIPKDSVLRFEGGSIKNGYIIGDNTTIIAPLSSEIFTGSTLIGSWKNIDFYPKWFGAVADGITDDTDVLQAMLDLSTNISSYVNLIWYNSTFKTTRQLYLKSNTSIKGGTIKAKFDNQMSWVLKTYNYVAASDKVYGDSNPGALVSWQEHDSGTVQQVNGGTIEDLTIQGEYNEHLTNGEPDGTYTPIFGGLCLMATATVNTKNVRISGVGVAIARGACLKTCDEGLHARGLFVGFAGYAINGHSIRDSYLNAYCKTEASESSTQITPYYPEYQTIVTLPKSGYVYNEGGIDMTDDSNRRPLLCNMQLVFNFSTIVDNPNTFDVVEPSEDEELSVLIDNALIDMIAEVGLCATAHSNVTLRHTWFEQVNKCLVYASDSKVTVDNPYVSSQNEYDIYTGGSTETVITLKGCSGDDGIRCAGGTTATYKKYNITDKTRINILDARVSPYPVDDDRFYFLTAGSVVGLPVSVIPSSGTGSLTNNTLNAASGTYYRFNYTVNTLVVNLPDMTGVSSARPVMLYLETGANQNITFTSPDNKTISKYYNYEIDVNGKYEINCLYNGQKWVIASAVIL